MDMMLSTNGCVVISYDTLFVAINACNKAVARLCTTCHTMHYMPDYALHAMSNTH